MIIFLEKQENIYELLKRMSSLEDEEIEIIVPEYAFLTKGSLNFKILSHFAKENHKTLHIVTTDKIASTLAEKENLKVMKTPSHSNDQKLSEAEEAQIADLKVVKEDEKTSVSPSKDSTSKSGKDADFVVNEPYDTSSDISTAETTPNEVDSKNLSVSPKASSLKYPKSRSFGKIFFIFILLSLVFLIGLGAFAYFILPKAKVSIILAGKNLDSEMDVTVDVAAIDVNINEKIIPGSIVNVEETGSKEIATTGKEEIGEKASGTISLRNYTSSDTLFISGTVFTVKDGETGAGLTFISSSGVTVPAATETTEEEDGRRITVTDPGTIDIPVSASQIGTSYNLKANINFLVGSEAYSDFSGENAAAFTGGSKEEVSVVSQADFDNLLAVLSAELKNKGETDLQSKLVGDQKFLLKTVEHEILTQAFNKSLGERTDKVALTLTIESKATFYSESQLRQIVRNSISSAVPEGYYLDDDKITITPEFTEKQDNGNLVFNVSSYATVYPLLPENEIKNALRGQKVSDAEAYLKNLDKVLGYNLEVWPPFPENFRRMPFLDTRFEIITEIKEE